VVVQGKNEADWNDEDKAAIKTDREKYELKLQEGRKRVKSFVQGFAAGGTLGSLGVAGFETIMTNSMKEFFADRATDVKNFAGNAAGAMGEAADATKNAIGNIDLFPFNNGTPSVKTPESVPTPLQGNEQPDGIGSSTPSEVSAPVAPDVNLTPIDIKSGDTVTSILRNSGVNINNPSEYYGSMGDVLKNSWDKFAADRAQMGFGDMPFPKDRLQTVIDQAKAGNPSAQGELTEALHWIKAGDKLTIPTAKVAA
jgi:hypothetical protein